MKKFDQTPYKLPPPTPIHVPAEKRPLEEKSLPFSKKRSKVCITPVMRRVSRRPELPMAPVQILHILEPMQIPLVPHSPVQILDVAEPVQIPLSQVPQPTVQIQVSQDPQPPKQIPVSRPTATCADSTYPRTTCANSSVTNPQSPVQILPVWILHVPEIPVQISESQVPQPPVQISHVPEPPVPILHAPEPMQILHVPEPMQILHVPEPMQIPPELVTLDPLESTDVPDQLVWFVFGPPAQELQLLHTVTSIFDGDLISFLDEFERELAPMDLTMPKLNPCVKKSIGFKAIQPMDLSVNSCQ
ncbi:hypothetical protein TNCV_3846201 [Trichonephila clavipes]|nr:hypothetical protein TNCV_3846201 [Trichonephila clavipes]